MANKKEFTIKSHAQARREDLSRFNTFKAPTEVVEEIEESTLDKGVKVVKVRKVTKKLSDRYKGLNWYDFSIDSLAAAGALGSQSLSTLEGDILDNVEKIDSTITNLENINVEE